VNAIAAPRSLNTNIRQSIKRWKFGCYRSVKNVRRFFSPSLGGAADQDKRDDTQFYSLFSTICARAIRALRHPRVCVRARNELLAVSRLIASPYLARQGEGKEAAKRAEGTFTRRSSPSHSNNKWKRLISRATMTIRRAEGRREREISKH
jgi:hypothetical protein